MPQEGSIEQHLVQYKKHVDEQIPDINNSGLIIIDFESWRPIFRQNFGALKPYKDLSIKIEQKNHPFRYKSINEAEVRLILLGIFVIEQIFTLRLPSDSKNPVRILLSKQFFYQNICDPMPNGDIMGFHIASIKILSIVQVKLKVKMIGKL